MMAYPVANRCKTVMHDEKSIPEALHDRRKTNFSLHFI